VTSPAAGTRWLAEHDPVFAVLVERHGPCRFGTRPRIDERFTTLARAICYQQLAGRAAATIWGRVEAAVGAPFTAEAVLATGEAALRAAGLSRAKMLSILDLASHVADGRLDLRRFGRLDDEAVIAGLVHVRGIGRWTAEMFCIAALHRLDVWPVTDLGVRHGYAVAHGLDGLPEPKDLIGLGERLRPYRSVAAWYCWRASDDARANGDRGQARPKTQRDPE
jgi:3-methyladenine DNA glycosylase/8-oxoguanine DNA glycosylase